MDIYFWAIAIGLGLPLWWFAFYATKRMRIGKNLEREAQAKRNLERLKMEQAASQQAEKQAADELGTNDADTDEQKSVAKVSTEGSANVETSGKQG